MWKQLKISPYYSVNENGDVKRNAYIRTDTKGRKTYIKEMILKKYLDKDKYYRVMITTGLNKPKFIPIHRLVADTFLQNNNNYNSINHKNEDKLDNRIENLEWCSVDYNNNYGTRNQKAQSTLTKKYGKKIIAEKDNKQYIFKSVNEAGRKLNVNTSNIFNCLKGLIKTTGGYNFKEYIKEEI